MNYLEKLKEFNTIFKVKYKDTPGCTSIETKENQNLFIPELINNILKK